MRPVRFVLMCVSIVSMKNENVSALECFYLCSGADRPPQYLLSVYLLDCKDVRPPCFQRTRTGARSHLVSCRCIQICQARAPLRVGRWRWRHDGAAHGDIYTAKAVIRIVINHGDVRIRSSAYGGSLNAAHKDVFPRGRRSVTRREHIPFSSIFFYHVTVGLENE